MPDLPRARPTRRLALCAAVALLCASVVASAATRGYAERGRCAGFARVELQAPPGHCVALVADEREGLRWPRRLLEVAPGRFWITDMGSWEPDRGRLVELTVAVPAPGEGAASAVTVRVLADRLDRPHGLALGPDGKVYVGEAGAVWRTPVAEHIAREDIVTGLPNDGAHPLKEIAFAPLEGGARLFISIGSETDACRDGQQRQPQPCAEGTGATPRAAVYEAQLGGAQLTLQSLRPWATGLRNSMGLLWLPSAQALLQAENSIDYADASEPSEELNLLREGGFYGWPYCVGARRTARGYEGRATCAASEAPLALWPAHAAPLSLAVAPAASPQAGSLFAAWHGWRAAGHRVVRFDVDASGRAVGPPVDWVAGWTAQAGVRPAGAPSGLAFDHAGRLWIVEDRNRSVLLVWPDAPRTAAAPARPQR